MNLPEMIYSDGIRKYKQVKFGGLNHTRGAGDGSLYDMKNLCSDDYPVLSVRPKRRTVGQVEKPNGLFYWKGLMWVDGTDVYFDGQVVGQVADSKKTFGAIGPYIVILPDKVCYNTKTEAFGYLDEEVIIPTGEVTFSNNKLTIPNIYYGAKDGGTRTEEAQSSFSFDCYDKIGVNKLSGELELGKSLGRLYPDELKAGYYWPCNRDGKTGYAITEEVTELHNPDFTPTGRYFVRFQFWYVYKYDVGDPLRNFRDGDGVEISGCSTFEENNGNRIIRSVSGDSLIFDENAFQGIGQEMGEVTIRRKVPELRYLCEDGNRLWGCSGDSIYASKLGDPFNWNVFDLLETDSWALTPASSGAFTGCINYQGYPTFFKEDRLYKVYGQTPSTFSVVDSPCLGVAAGCADTMAMVLGSVFYLGTNGPMVYSGSLPRKVDNDLGEIRLVSGCAGSDGLKYYASLMDNAGGQRLYVYDVQRGLWHIEDELAAVGFCRVEGDMYCMGADGGIRILGAAKAVTGEREGSVNWMAEFSDFTHDDPNQKGVEKLQLRLELEAGSTVTVLLQFDSDGVWHRVRTLLGEGSKRSYYLPIIPRRCDHYRLRLEGVGRARLYSLVRESYSGSERSAK